MFGDTLKILREQRGWTQSELGVKVDMAKSTISMLECGKRMPSYETLEAFADVFNVDMNMLTGKSVGLASNIIPMPTTHKVPRLGTIACGTPILAEQNIAGFDEVPEYIKADFTLICKGDSMINARIYDGDVVCVRQQSMVDNGEIAAVLIDDEATLKRVRLFNDHIVLEPENPQFRPLVYWGEEMNNVRILGKATHFISVVR